MGNLTLAQIAEYISQGQYIFYMFTWKNNRIKEITIEPYQERVFNYTGERGYYRSNYVVVNEGVVMTLGQLYDKKSKQGHIFHDSVLAENFRRSRVE